MKLKIISGTNLAVDPQLQWVFYSAAEKSFISGDERSAFALPTAAPGKLITLPPLPQNMGPSNFPIADSLLDEFVSVRWHGLNFLSRKYSQPTGDLLRTLVFGPDYGQYVRHPATGQILSLRSKSIKLLRLSGDEFQALDQTKTRGKATLAFAAHPDKPLLVYGDNYGLFHAHALTENGFGKATKIADKQRKSSRLDFTADGNSLIIGGMGYLASFEFSGDKLVPVHEISVPVRDFVLMGSSNEIIINQGMQGLAVYRLESTGFDKLAEVNPGTPVQQIAISDCGRFIGFTSQGSPTISICEVVNA